MEFLKSPKVSTFRTKLYWAIRGHARFYLCVHTLSRGPNALTLQHDSTRFNTIHIAARDYYNNDDDTRRNYYSSSFTWTLRFGFLLCPRASSCFALVQSFLSRAQSLCVNNFAFEQLGFPFLRMLFDVAMSVALDYPLRVAMLGVLLEVLGGEDGDWNELRRTLVQRLREVGYLRLVFFEQHHLGYTLWLLEEGETIDGGQEDREVVVVDRVDFRRRDLPLMQAISWVMRPPGTQVGFFYSIVFGLARIHEDSRLPRDYLTITS